jgi:hypothetical protein
MVQAWPLLASRVYHTYFEQANNREYPDGGGEGRAGKCVDERETVTVAT